MICNQSSKHFSITKNRMCVFIFSICVLLSSPSFCQAKSSISWKKKVKTNRAAIIFVHGLNGSGLKTWSGKRSGRNWTDMLRLDEAFKDADIGVFNYDSGEAAPSMSIEDIAKNASSLLKLEDINAYSDITFVAHSMGGVVIKLMLLANQEIVRKSKVYLHLFGVPANGKELGVVRKIALIASGKYNKQMDQLITNNGLFSIINLFWEKVSDYVYTVCYFETSKTRIKSGVVSFNDIVVTKKNSDVSCDKREVLNKDHYNIVKPDNEKDNVYKFFRSNFKNREKHTKRLNNRTSRLIVDVSPVSRSNVNIYKIHEEINYQSRSGVFVQPGQYLVQIKGGDISQLHQVEVKGKLTKKLYYISRPPQPRGNGYICIYGEPTNASVDISGPSYTPEKKRQGQGKFDFEKKHKEKCRKSAPLRSGNYTVKVRKKGYKEERQSVNVNGKIEVLRFVLQKK